MHRALLPERYLPMKIRPTEHALLERVDEPIESWGRSVRVPGSSSGSSEGGYD